MTHFSADFERVVYVAAGAYIKLLVHFTHCKIKMQHNKKKTEREVLVTRDGTVLTALCTLQKKEEKKKAARSIC